MTANTVGGMFGFFFSDEQVTRFDQVASGVEKFNKFFHLMLDQGIYLAPSAYEAGFTSQAMTYDDLDETIAAAKHAFAQMV